MSDERIPQQIEPPPNPPAFPVSSIDIHGYPHVESGVSTRDYFAAAAMQALMANPQNFSEVRCHESCAYEAYQMADSMLAERNKGQD